MASAGRERRIRVGLVAYTGCSAWVSAGIVELFDLANLNSRGSRRGRVRFETQFVSASGRGIRASHGVRLPAGAARGRYQAVIVPPLWAPELAEFERRLASLHRQVSPLLQRLRAKSSIVASACSGAALLAQAGLLDGRRATTCWWFADRFAARFPEVRLQADRLVVADGDRWTAAAGTAYLHLVLELVKAYAGADVAAATARLALVEPRRGSQSPFLAQEFPRPGGEAAGPVGEMVRWIDSRLEQGFSMAELALRLGVTERTLHRRFRRTFGVTPLIYVQSRRIARARHWLEVTDEPFERIVERCGYLDVSSFRRLFVREVGMTPREYRLRFAR